MDEPKVRRGFSSPGFDQGRLSEWDGKNPPIAFDDPRVQTVYRILCDTTEPPPEEHWEGFVARRIVAALSDA